MVRGAVADTELPGHEDPAPWQCGRGSHQVSHPGCRRLRVSCRQKYGASVVRTSGLGPTNATSTLFIMVGLPASGKTTQAKEIEEARQALRLTPDEWMIPLFGEPEADGKREVLEGSFLWLATRALRHGTDVVLDFGVWTKDERSALKFLAGSVGASWKLLYFEISDQEQRRRHDERISRRPDSTFPMSDDDLREYRRLFEAPDQAELRSSEIDPPPAGYVSWSSWISERWPTSISGTSADDKMAGCRGHGKWSGSSQRAISSFVPLFRRTWPRSVVARRPSRCASTSRAPVPGDGRWSEVCRRGTASGKPPTLRACSIPSQSWSTRMPGRPARTWVPSSCGFPATRIRATPGGTSIRASNLRANPAGS